LPDLSAAALDRFDRIFATGQDAARRLIRITGSPGRVLALGALGDTALPPSCNPDEHEEMSQTLAGRPVWLAAHVSKAELPDILRAHRRASRLAHRLLLVLVPEDALLYPLFRQQVHEEAMRLCDWAQGDMPDENTQVLLADDPDTLGLWYRIAPLTFVAGSLSAEGGGGHSPFDAAALGSAVLHGPNVSAYRDAYGRLAAVKAARLVNTADDLYRSVIALSAPDKAAVMAHAAWEIVSESANLTDAVIDWAVDVLDQRGAA
jgi:3-deoxy-D-manno-octulosonic-acid transferase